MDPINIIILLNIIATFAANLSGAKKGLKSSFTAVREKPKTYLQLFPTSLATASLVLLILAVFQIGTFTYNESMIPFRSIALAIYLIFSWIQIWAYKSLGENYAQDIIILKNHSLIQNGPYKIIRHPHYASQIIIDVSAAAATLSFLILPVAIIEIPFLILRARLEEKLLLKYFHDDYNSYKQKKGFMIPFVG